MRKKLLIWHTRIVVDALQAIQCIVRINLCTHGITCTTVRLYRQESVGVQAAAGADAAASFIVFASTV
jgi:hypothetical protein